MPTTPKTKPRNTSPLPVSVLDIAVAAAAAVVLVFVSLGLSAVVFFFSLNVAGCGSSHPCDYELSTVAVYITPITGVIALVLGVILTFVFAKRDRPLWQSFAPSYVLVTVAFIVAIVVNYRALGPIIG